MPELRAGAARGMSYRGAHGERQLHELACKKGVYASCYTLQPVHACMLACHNALSADVIYTRDRTRARPCVCVMHGCILAFAQAVASHLYRLACVRSVPGFQPEHVSCAALTTIVPRAPLSKSGHVGTVPRPDLPRFYATAASPQCGVYCITPATTRIPVSYRPCSSATARTRGVHCSAA